MTDEARDFHNPDAEPKSAHERLKEWGIERKRPPWEAWPETTVLQRIREEGSNAGVRTDEQSDGGVGAMVDRMHRALAKQRRCRDVQVLVDRLERSADENEREHYELIKAAYMGPWVPRNTNGVLEELPISRKVYLTRRAAMLAWVTYHLDLHQRDATTVPPEAPVCECTDHVVCVKCLKEWTANVVEPLIEELVEIRRWPLVMSLKRRG